MRPVAPMLAVELVKFSLKHSAAQVIQMRSSLKRKGLFGVEPLREDSVDCHRGAAGVRLGLMKTPPLVPPWMTRTTNNCGNRKPDRLRCCNSPVNLSNKDYSMYITHVFPLPLVVQ